MNVEHILMAKGRDVLTIEPSRTLADAARALTEKRIGAVIVGGPDEAVLGILSERDIVRAVARGGAAALERSGVAAHDRQGRDLHAADRPSTSSWTR